MKFNNHKFVYKEDFLYKDQQIHFTPSGKAKVKKIKKITGSRIGSVFGIDSFKTPFQLGCDLLGMYVDESDKFFLEAGQIIEPKLKKYAEEKIGKKFKSYDPKEIGYDLFSDVDIFGGIPDGEEYDEDNNLVSILEIKTAQLDKYKGSFKNNQFMLDVSETGKPQIKTHGGGLVKGFKNGEVLIPKSYQYQLSLYLYLRGITRGYFCVAFIKFEDYENPKDVNFISEFNDYKGYEIFDQITANREDHLLVWKEHILDREQFEKELEYAKEGYSKYVLNFVSPPMTSEDLAGFRYGYPEIV